MFRRIALFLLLAVCPAIAAVDTTTVVGTLYLPDGTVVTGGTIRAALSIPGSTPDGDGSGLIVGWGESTISLTGAFSITLVPNDALDPPNSYYEILYTVTSPVLTSWTELRYVETSAVPVDIGDVTLLDAELGIVAGTYMSYVSTAPSDPCTADDGPTYVTATDAICKCVDAAWVCKVLVFAE